MKIISYITAGIVGIVIGLVLGYSSHGNVGSVSTVGTTNTSARLASTVMVPTSASATSTYLLNTGSDRAVTNAFAYCTGITKASTQLGANGLQVQAATSSSVKVTLPTTNYVMNLSIATSSSYLNVASTTSGNDMWRLWPASSYLIIAFNATNTANCTVGVNYLSL